MKIGKINLSFWEIIIVMVVHWVVSSSELKIQELLQPGSPNSLFISILFYLFKVTRHSCQIIRQMANQYLRSRNLFPTFSISTFLHHQNKTWNTRSLRTSWIRFSNYYILVRIRFLDGRSNTHTLSALTEGLLVIKNSKGRISIFLPCGIRQGHPDIRYNYRLWNLSEIPGPEPYNPVTECSVML